MGETHLAFLKQGDIVGQYSALFDETVKFTARAVSKVRLLTLGQEFYDNTIDGLPEAIERAE